MWVFGVRVYLGGALANIAAWLRQAEMRLRWNPMRSPAVNCGFRRQCRDAALN
jgi:hypothetical protein